jgi:type IV secretory pathway TraG/TraD family ATPase VirD4
LCPRRCGSEGSNSSKSSDEQRCEQPGRDAILAASTAQLLLPPLADLTTTNYITTLLGEEPVTQATQHRSSRGQDTLSTTSQNAVNAPWLRQIQRGHTLLVYRDMPPAITRTLGWYEDPRFYASAPGGT